MALTDTQVRVLNELKNTLPGLRYGQLLPQDEILLGDILKALENAGVATITSPAATAASGGDSPTEAEFNAVVTLVNEIRTKINAA